MEDFEITLLYGPYSSNGIIRHKTQRLRGLMDYLTNNQFLVKLFPSPHLNRLVIEFKDREIFRCDIRHLPFNRVCDGDTLCMRILDVIAEHKVRFMDSRNQPNFPNLKEGMRWMVNESADLKKESLDRVFDYDLYTPQNSIISGAGITMLPEDFSLVDICKKYGYLGYDLHSVDLVMSQHDSVEKEKEVKICAGFDTSSSSQNIDDFTVCDEGPCYPICPPPSEVNTVSEEEEEEQEEEEEVEIEIEVEAEEEEVPEKGILDVLKTEEVFYQCKQCKRCFCICDKDDTPVIKSVMMMEN